MSEVQQYPFKQLEKFQLYTETPNTPGKRSRMVFSSYRGNPRITVFTNVPNDGGKGVINAAMNPETFLVFLDLLETVAKSPAEAKHKIDCMSMPKQVEGQENSREKFLAAELYFGRDANGIIWISVTAPNRPRIKFEYRVSEFHKIYKGDGTQLTESEGSTLQAIATIRALREVFIVHMSELAAPYVPGENNGSNAKAKAKETVKPVSSPEFDDLTF